jgi:hypothetical protein
VNLVEKQQKQVTSCFLLDVLLESVDGSNMFARNLRLNLNYTALESSHRENQNYNKNFLLCYTLTIAPTERGSEHKCITDFQGSLHSFTYFIILAILFCSVVNMSMFQDHEVIIILQLFRGFSYINKYSLVNKGVFQILEFHHATEINNKWIPRCYRLLYTICNTIM